MTLTTGEPSNGQPSVSVPCKLCAMKPFRPKQPAKSLSLRASAGMRFFCKQMRSNGKAICQQSEYEYREEKKEVVFQYGNSLFFFAAYGECFCGGKIISYAAKIRSIAVFLRPFWRRLQFLQPSLPFISGTHSLYLP